MYLLAFYVPATELEKVKQAVFKTGAGVLGNYDACCFQIKGEGQFRPLAGSLPHIGVHNQLEIVEEYKVELIVQDELLQHAITALINAHPYETPAYHVIRLDQPTC